MSGLKIRPSALRQRMRQTGIGFAGLDGAWWRPACNPFALPVSFLRELHEIGHALFTLFDVVQDLYRVSESDSLREILAYKVPDQIPKLVGQGRLLSIRPDFQLSPTDDGWQPVITELEICPSAHGFAHAMQVGYGLEQDLVSSFARLLDGRTLFFVCSADWSEFLFEQLAFCKGLEMAGAHGLVLYDQTMEALAEEISLGRRWQPPIFGVKNRPAGWNLDLSGRIRTSGLDRYLWSEQATIQPGIDTMLFRFGYFDNFSSEALHRMESWEAGGAVFLAPLSYYLENKVLMAALRLPEVRERVGFMNPPALATLDRCIPETILLKNESASRLLAEKDAWVLKYAGYDGGNRAWGGRSLEIGLCQSDAEWESTVRRYLSLSWPAVAQRAVPSAKVDVAYYDAEDRGQLLRDGTTRLRAFLLRNEHADGDREQPVTVCGCHLTVSNRGIKVAEGVDAVQAPVVFAV